jgi:hypothetical protein
MSRLHYGRPDYLQSKRAESYLASTMRLPLFAAVVLGSALYVAAQTSQPSDLTIVIRSVNGNLTETTTEYFKGPRSRIEMNFSAEGHDRQNEPMNRFSELMSKHPRATIVQCDQHQQLSLDLLGHEYSSTEIDDLGRPVQHQPPMETQPSGATVTVTVETTDTGERKQFFGRTARHIITKESSVAGPGAVSSFSQFERDGWYIDLDANTGCGKHRGTGGGGVLGGSVGGFHSVPKIDKIEWKYIGTPVTGLPVELVTRQLPDSEGREPAHPAVSHSEVTELSTAPVDPSLFEPPAGFTKVDHLN